MGILLLLLRMFIRCYCSLNTYSYLFEVYCSIRAVVDV